MFFFIHLIRLQGLLGYLIGIFGKEGGALYDTCNCQINHDKTHLFFTSCIGLHVCMCCQIRLNFTYSSSISAVFPIISQSKQTISKSNKSHHHVEKIIIQNPTFQFTFILTKLKGPPFMFYQGLLTLSF